MVYPKKHLGQHFLTDPSIAERVVKLLPEDKAKIVMEIGPGKGILTYYLIRENIKKLIPVEIDSESVNYLVRKYPELKETIVGEDFLKMDENHFHEEGLHIIGNFPYNISSQIFFRVLEQRQYIQSVVCMIQKEVAERIVAPPGSKTYGILSVLLQAYYDTRFRFNVKPGSFFPPPKVTSSVITLNRNKTQKLGCDEKLFFRVVKTAFNQRRKTLRNSLRTILLTLGDENELLSKKPEQLGVEDFVSLTNFVESRM
ncbi:MAG: 16S rRNA (adenine(1518)-N(6)/adenine(1519)-N(6))-dimethyltransferase RsmA [Bacteroidales bacterium]